MSDTWQYRVRVSGSDRAKWLAKAKEGAWGLRSGSPMYSWPMDGAFRDGKVYKADANWFNVKVTDGAHGAEFLGNCSGSPLHFFSKKDPFKWRVGPPLFGDLDIEVEIVGLSWSCDNGSTGVSSYRDVYLRGVQTFTVEANDESVAKKYAPELVAKFPDEYTPEERAEMAAEDEAYRREEERLREERQAAAKRAAAERPIRKRAVWDALRFGALVKLAYEAGSAGDAPRPARGVVERTVRAHGREVVVLHEHFDGFTERFSGQRFEVAFDELQSVERAALFCVHSHDHRLSLRCPDCEKDEAERAHQVKCMIDGLHKRVVL